MQSAQAKTYYKPKPAEKRPAVRQYKKDGNVVYLNNGYAKKNAPQNNVKAAVNRKPKAKPGLVSTLAVLFIAFCALAVLVSRYAAVCSIGSQNNELEKRIESVEAQIDSLAVDLELKDDIEYVHSAAQDELGMMYPDQSQRITISLDG